MKMGRIIRGANGFERVTLEEHEEEEILETVRKVNLDLFQRCLRDATSLTVNGPALVGPEEMRVAATIAVALFEKQATDVRDAIAWRLEEKVFYLKEYAKTLEAMEA